MDLTLDYNVELFPLQKDQNFALALASSLGRGGTSGNAAEASQDEANENERDVWRPDGKGSRGLEDEYDYVMYGKVRNSRSLSVPGLIPRKIYKFDGGSGEVVYVFIHIRFLVSYQSQDCIYLVRWTSYVLDWLIPAYDEYCSWRPCLSPHAKLDFPPGLVSCWLPESSFWT